ncbi:MAG: GNAT family N-acetyltransferase [Halopenitus sp.]
MPHSDVEVREATLADAERLAAVYRSAYAENRALGFPASAESATAAEVSEWIAANTVFVAVVDEGGSGAFDGNDNSDEGGSGAFDGNDNGDEGGSGAFDGNDKGDEGGSGAFDGEDGDDAGDGTVVGGVRLTEVDVDHGKISRFGVHEDWKRRGIGTTLLEHAEGVCRERKYDSVRLTTPGEHPVLPDFYRSRGYEIVGDYPLEYRKYDEIVMAKPLGDASLSADETQ